VDQQQLRDEDHHDVHIIHHRNPQVVVEEEEGVILQASEPTAMTFTYSANDFDESSRMMEEEKQENQGDGDVQVDVPPTNEPVGGESDHHNTHVRQKWGSRISFILATLGAAIGFGE